MWVAGDEDDKLYASSLVIGARDATKDTVAQSHTVRSWPLLLTRNRFVGSWGADPHVRPEGTSNMNPVQEAVTSVLRNYSNFSGRAARPEFWWFALAAFVVSVIVGWIPIIGQIVGVVLALLSLGVAVRRLHDSDRPGWWIIPPYAISIVGLPMLLILIFTDLWVLALLFGFLWGLIALAAGIALLVVLAQPGTSGPNKYGPDPLQP